MVSILLIICLERDLVLLSWREVKIGSSIVVQRKENIYVASSISVADSEDKYCT